MSAPASSIKAVITALLANAAVTVAKFVGFVLSGSGAMLSEAIHSLADTGNQVLLLVGLKRATRQSDAEFHYGYGGERFIFGILSAAGIFFVGCGVTVYHGIHTLLHPAMPRFNVLTVFVLGFSFVVEGAVLIFAIRIIASQRGELSFARYLRERADPAALAILTEDSAAVLGLCLAGAGIALSQATLNPIWDSIASILVGLLLGLVAIYLILENRALLLGKAVPDDAAERFSGILRRKPSLKSFHDVKTEQLTPEIYRLKAEIVLDEAFLARALEAALPADLCGERRPEVLAEISRSALHLIAREIDDIEDEIRRSIPEARHIDLEVDYRGSPATLVDGT